MNPKNDLRPLRLLPTSFGDLPWDTPAREKGDPVITTTLPASPGMGVPAYRNATWNGKENRTE
jgi:hypothetical protein